MEPKVRCPVCDDPQEVQFSSSIEGGYGPAAVMKYSFTCTKCKLAFMLIINANAYSVRLADEERKRMGLT